MATLYALFFNGNTAMRARRRSSVLPRKSNPRSVHLFFKDKSTSQGGGDARALSWSPAPAAPSPSLVTGRLALSPSSQPARRSLLPIIDPVA